MQLPEPGPTAVTSADVAAAAQILEGVAHRTPVLRSRTLDAELGAEVHFKCEALQRVGAFKFRGAYHALRRLAPEVRARGVLAWSSGNHAQALALAGRTLGCPVVIVMPEDAPAPKRAATEGYGAEVVPYRRGEVVREDLGRALAAERGLTIIPPYDHPHVIAGQGTAAWELLEEVPDLEVVVAPCGGGGLLSGTALATRARAPRAQVWGVEPEAADDAARSFRSGTLVTVQEPATVADGARTPSLGRYTFPLVRAHVDDFATVPDDALIEAMRWLWSRLKVVVEPTGALGLAALRTGAIPVRGKRVGVILSGGNVDLDALPSLFAG